MTSTARRVIGHVAARTGIPADQITGPGRQRVNVLARRRAIALFRRLRYSTVQIRFALNRDHSTVHHHLRWRQ